MDAYRGIGKYRTGYRPGSYERKHMHKVMGTFLVQSMIFTMAFNGLAVAFLS
jgi:hypothetical protein